MELREYVRACRRRWVWLVVPVLVAAGLAASLTLTAGPAYRSSMVLFVTTGTGDPDARASRLNSYIALLAGPRVADTVVRKLGPPLTSEDVQRSLSAQVQEGTDLLVISATGPSAPQSRAIVTTATTALIGLAKQLDPPSRTTDGPRPSVSIAQGPVTTRAPDDAVRTIVLAGVLGLLIGAVAVAVREATRRTVADQDDLRRLGLDAVGVISLGSRSSRSGPPGEALAEAFRRLRSLLPNLAEGHDAAARGTSLLLTGTQPREGTTAVACGLAIAMAETGARVVLVDANLRSPGLGRYLALDTRRGLADVLAGRAGLPEVLQDSLDGRLTVLPCGEDPADPGVILASPRLGTTLRGLTEAFDVVLVDAPPLHGVADAVVLSKVTDRALLVVRANRTRTAEVARSTDLLERVGARLAGAVLNALPRKLPTATAWHRAQAVVPPPPDGRGLVTGPAKARPAADTLVVPPHTGPVRGRARVVDSTVAGRGDAARRPHGRARVVNVEPEPPNLPAQRGTPAEEKRPDEKRSDDE